MKLLKVDAGRYVFRIGRREKSLLAEVLQHFPLIPTEHHKATRQPATGVTAESQEMLTETMASFKERHKERVRLLLEGPQRFVPDDSGFRVTLEREELEWLLQVLNDVRVGSWLKLGAPDPEEGKRPELSRENARYLFLMELSGHFECALLDALDGADGAVDSP